jgi:hypothetical protein
MNAGFSNLDYLKRQLLANTLKNDKSFDDKLLAIGRGVASSFDRYCNRELSYAQGLQEVFTGDRPFWYTRRKPVTQFTKVELRFFRPDAWTDISGQPVSADEEKGLIHFGYTLGQNPLQVRLTYNGGFYFNTLEPDAANYLDPMSAAYFAAIPADISANQAGIDPNKFLLPGPNNENSDLLLAWVTQCRKAWEAIDKVGNNILGVGSKTGGSEALVSLELVPQVKETLKYYRRYSLT